jgi:TatD DNase family protein
MIPTLIDTHAHLYAKEFLEDFDQVIARAQEKGVSKILLPNIDQESIARMHFLSQAHPKLFIPMMGIHPCYVTKEWEKQVNTVETHLSQANNYCAVGEIGIDLYWDKTLLDQQKKSFRAQIKLAIKYKLPIVIHARASFDEIFDIIDAENCPELTGVFHCFTGSTDQAHRIINYGGFKIGIGGVVTYKNAGLDQVVAQIPLEHLLLETDSPYLPPVPYRGKRNESAYVSVVANKIAELHDVSPTKIAEITTHNATALFGL